MAMGFESIEIHILTSHPGSSLLWIWVCKVSAWLQAVTQWFGFIVWWFWLHYLSVKFEAGCWCHLERDVVCKTPEVQTTKGATKKNGTGELLASQKIPNPPSKKKKKKDYLAVNPCSYLKFKSIYGTLCLLSLELDHDIGMYFGKKKPIKWNPHLWVRSIEHLGSAVRLQHLFEV